MTSVSAAQRVLMPSCLAAAPTGHTASSRPPRVAGGIGAIAGQLRDADADVVPIRPHITFSAARHCISLHRITSVNAIGDSRETPSFPNIYPGQVLSDSSVLRSASAGTDNPYNDENES
jgi:hypothetical protein